MTDQRVFKHWILYLCPVRVRYSGQMLREREALEDSKDTDHYTDTPGGRFMGQVM